MASSYWYIPSNIIPYQEDDSTIDESIVTDSSEEEYQESIIYDSDYEDQDADIIHRMYFHDREFHSLEKVNGFYYLGSCHPSGEEWLLNMVISPNLLFSHPYKMICKYLTEYSCPRFQIKGVEIMQLFIVQSPNRYWIYYTVVKKTYWIRLVQRHWRKVYSAFKTRIPQLKTPKMQYYRQIRGKYPIGFNSPQLLYGLLSSYRNVSKYKN